jgi:hypothetical protein
MPGAQVLGRLAGCGVGYRSDSHGRRTGGPLRVPTSHLLTRLTPVDRDGFPLRCHTDRVESHRCHSLGWQAWVSVDPWERRTRT